MKMFDSNPNVTLAERDYNGSGAWSTRAPMLALSNPDPALQLPAGVSLQPKLFARNTQGHPAKVQLRFHWRDQTQDGRFILPQISLNPYETRLVDVKTLQDEGLIPKSAYWSQVTLTTDGKPDEVMAVATSYDSTLRYGAQTPFSDQLADHFEGTLWQVDPTHTTISTIGNGGAQPVTVTLNIFYDHGTKQYSVEKTIQPDDQFLVNFADLIRNQQPDKKGNTIPAATTSGTYQLKIISQPLQTAIYEGKVITDKTFGHATYGCVICCSYRPGGFAPDPAGVVLGFTDNVGIDGTDTCGNFVQDISGYYQYWWSSDNSIFTMKPASLTGVSVGSAGMNATSSKLPRGGPGTDNPPFCPVLSAVADGQGHVLSCGDVRDNIIQEYIAFGIGFIPVCSDFTQTAHSVYFTFAEINVTGDYTWALIRQPLIAVQSSGYGLDAWRTAYGGPRIINSGYRNPAHNAAVGGAPQSRHVYGDAADFRNQSYGTSNQTAEWQAMVNAATVAHADFIEPSTGPCKYACTHADWRAHPGGYAP